MPILSSSYTPPLFFKNGHFATIYPNLFRKIHSIQQKRERVELDDGDFIDLDWSYSKKNKTERLVITVHGLEGNAQRPYMLGLADYLNHNNWDVASMNLRNCSGETNRLYKSYNAGASDDLERIILHIINSHNYSDIALCGFSLGGNLTLKYLGEGRKVPHQIIAAVGISVPCDLYDSLTEINKPTNFLYKYRFLYNLKSKLRERQKQFPDQLSVTAIESCQSLMEIDDLYTSVAHGYKNALDYYQQCSSAQFLSTIKVPTLIINAKNDTFLGDSCYPVQEAHSNPSIYLETPDYGGHVGFYHFRNTYYHEMQTLQFINGKTTTK